MMTLKNIQWKNSKRGKVSSGTEIGTNMKGVIVRRKTDLEGIEIGREAVPDLTPSLGMDTMQKEIETEAETEVVTEIEIEIRAGIGAGIVVGIGAETDLVRGKEVEKETGTGVQEGAPLVFAPAHVLDLLPAAKHTGLDREKWR